MPFTTTSTGTQNYGSNDEVCLSEIVDRCSGNYICSDYQPSILSCFLCENATLLGCQSLQIDSFTDVLSQLSNCVSVTAVETPSTYVYGICTIENNSWPVHLHTFCFTEPVNKTKIASTTSTSSYMISSVQVPLSSLLSTTTAIIPTMPPTMPMSRNTLSSDTLVGGIVSGCILVTVTVLLLVGITITMVIRRSE